MEVTDCPVTLEKTELDKGHEGLGVFGQKQDHKCVSWAEKLWADMGNVTK